MPSEASVLLLRPAEYLNQSLCEWSLPIGLIYSRAWLSGSGQMLSNEDEAILDSIIRLYFCQAVQIYTQIWCVFLLVPTDMLHVSIGAHQHSSSAQAA